MCRPLSNHTRCTFNTVGMLVERSCQIIVLLLFNLLKLLQPQPQAVGMRPQVSMATAPIVTPRNQSPGHITVGPHQLRQLTSGQSTCILCQRRVWSVCQCDSDISVCPVGPPGRTGTLPVFKPVPPAAVSLAQMNKLKEAGGTFK